MYLISSMYKSNFYPYETKRKQTRYSIEFTEKDAKTIMMKAKKRLKETRNLQITDDLTPTRAKLAYETRKALRGIVVYQAWTFDLKVFVKTTKDTKPRRITHADHHLPDDEVKAASSY